MQIKIDGIEALNKTLKNLHYAAIGAVRRQMQINCADLKGKAQRITPVDTGDLQGSAYYETEIFHDSVRAEVGFTENYSTRQHEELDYRHKAPGQAKYLEQPLNENIEKYTELIGQVTAKAMEDEGKM
jgi:hypothetical protein